MGVPGTVILSGVVGSTAYGLATEESDVDRLGVYAAPTVAFHGLHLPIGKSASHVTAKPDATYHEAAKYVTLALKANPTITELLWLPDGLYERKTELGEALIGLRSSLLSRAAVRNAYLGYATQQLRRLESRGDGSFSSDTRKRTAKHARHLYRLHAQGIMLWQTGRLAVRLSYGDAVLCRAFGKKVAAGNLDACRRIIAWAEHIFDTSSSPLPGRPDERAAEGWLLEVRKAFLG